MFGRWDCLGCRWRSQIAPPMLRQAACDKYLVAGALVCLVAAHPSPALAATLSDVDFANLAARCAPAVPEWVLRAVARTESNFHPWMLHDNTVHVSDSPASLAAAEVEASGMDYGGPFRRSWPDANQCRESARAGDDGARGARSLCVIGSRCRGAAGGLWRWPGWSRATDRLADGAVDSTTPARRSKAS